MKKISFFILLSVLLVNCKKEQLNGESSQTTNDAESVLQSDSLLIEPISTNASDTIAATLADSLMLEKPKNKSGFEIERGSKYSIWPHNINDSLRKKFNEEFSTEQKYMIAALNRIDTDHIARRDSLIVPNEFYEDFLEYSPFPHKVNVLNDVDKFLIFSYPVQAFAVYEKGILMKWGPSNMGKKATQTPRGLFFTNWKGRKVRSTVDDEWILNWNFNIHNTGGIGFHQYALPGYPASHSCLRLLDADAQYLYNWADQWILSDPQTVKVKGTPVIVYGDYNFGVKGDWYQLYKDPNVTTISETELTEVITPHKDEILKQQKIRQEHFEEISDF